MTEAEFTKKTGHEPVEDDLERINCDRVGEAGHHYCGWCSEHDLPRFVCACFARAEKVFHDD